MGLLYQSYQLHSALPEIVSLVLEYTLSYTTMTSGIQAFDDQSQESLKFLVVMQEYHN